MAPSFSPEGELLSCVDKNFLISPTASSFLGWPRNEPKKPPRAFWSLRDQAPLQKIPCWVGLKGILPCKPQKCVLHFWPRNFPPLRKTTGTPPPRFVVSFHFFFSSCLFSFYWWETTEGESADSPPSCRAERRCQYWGKLHMDVQFSFAGQDARQSDRNIDTGVKEVPKGPQRGVASLVTFLSTQESNSPSGEIIKKIT